MTWLKHWVQLTSLGKDAIVSLRLLIMVLLEDVLSQVMPKH